MFESHPLRTLVHAATFCARHGLAACVTVGAVGVLWSVVYLALLLWAIVTGGGLGGPLAYPAGLVFCLVVTATACATLLLPATAVAEAVVRCRGLSIAMQVPLSSAVVAGLCLACVGVAGAVRGDLSPRQAGVAFVILLATSLPLLGVYWWTAQSGPLVVRGVRWLVGRCRRLWRSSGGVPPAAEVETLSGW